MDVFACACFCLDPMAFPTFITSCVVVMGGLRVPYVRVIWWFRLEIFEEYHLRKVSNSAHTLVRISSSENGWMNG